MVGPVIDARELAAALFVGGLALPTKAIERSEIRIPAKLTAKRCPKQIMTFNLAVDRFDGKVGSMPDLSDLPPVIETEGDGVEWTIV